MFYKVVTKVKLYRYICISSFHPYQIYSSHFMASFLHHNVSLARPRYSGTFIDKNKLFFLISRNGMLNDSSLIFCLSFFQIVTLFILVVVRCHVCVLEKRRNPSLGGVLQWSIPYDEICYCQRVVVPRFISLETCARRDDYVCFDSKPCNLWFVDNPALLTRRRNWNKKALDQLLERTVYCGRFPYQTMKVNRRPPLR